MNSPAPALVAVHNLRAGYNDVEVVHGVTIEVHAGEVVALLGPNGAGKTTTLSTIAGLLPRLGGDCAILGATQPAGSRRRVVSAALRLRARGLAYVPEDRALFFGLTGRQHLRLAARRGDHEAIDAAVEPFPALRAILDRKAGLMSGGEQQMLAVARALASRPKVLMVDELSLGLAPIVVEQLLPLMRDVCRDQGLGVLLVEQHVNAALSTADRAYVMVRGEISIAASAADLLRDSTALSDAYLGGDHLPR
jgi:branched-chain amino acid transport system ATP-binding protein